MKAKTEVGQLNGRKYTLVRDRACNLFATERRGFVYCLWDGCHSRDGDCLVGTFDTRTAAIDYLENLEAEIVVLDSALHDLNEQRESEQ